MDRIGFDSEPVSGDHAMTSMREKIAERLIARRHGECRVTDWQREAAENPNIADALADADAVLDALMEPTKEMILGGNNAIDEHIDFWNYDSGSGYAVESAAAVACLQAMILAAKEGK
jgi:hypothetical protein